VRNSQEEKKMSKYAIVLTVGVVVLSSIAQGNLVSFSADELFTWSDIGAAIAQEITTIAPTKVTMTADADSTFIISTFVVNETGFTWSRYILTLDPVGATFVPGSAGSTKFLTVNYTNPHTLDFLAPVAVEPGQGVTFQFNINVPDGPPYTFTLTHQPIPEPATLALLGLGALVLVAGRRK
jgi:hypothetical protein